jgi:hypothetical protein
MIIWIEIELYSSSRHDIYSIAAAEWLNFETFTMKDWLNVKMSIEYYRKTIEYNFEPKKFSKAYINKVTKFILKQKKKYKLRLSNSAPSYVWMHIHIFDLKYRKLKWTELLSTSMYEINKYFDSLEVESRKRLALSHQLWWNYIWNTFPEYLWIIENEWFNMQYHWLCRDRPKYNPYIVSGRSNKWKPRSVEIRILPNEMLFTDWLFNLLSRINKQDYTELDIKWLLVQWLERLHS